MHECLLLIAYTENPPLNVSADVSIGARGINYDKSLHLDPCFVYASSEVSGESARVCALAQARVGIRCSKLCNTYQKASKHLGCLLIYVVGSKKTRLTETII